MERFVEKPNLPQGTVKTVVMGGAYPQVTEALRGLGINVIHIADNPGVDAPVRAHSDMSAYYCGNGKLILSENIFDACSSGVFPMGTVLQRSVAVQRDKYPLDIGLNACEIGDLIFCSIENTDAAIVEHAEKTGKKLINVRQGYAKCSVCILDEKHIITADRSIAEAARSEGLDVLLIKPGFFDLPGYDYGFIGGSCVKLDKSTLAFTGTLKGYENERDIIEFSGKCGIDIIYLTHERCSDVGSIIPIIERKENS